MDLAGKVFVVTGGNAGIGLAIVGQLAALGGHVVLVARNEGKGKTAADAVRATYPAAAITVVQGDVGTVSGAKALAASLLEQCPRIDVLINNAGVWPTKKALNADGFETAFAVNHMGPYVLSRMLLPRLQDCAPARIVNVNAGLYVNGKFALDRTPFGLDFSALRTYADSKLCNVLFTVELARRIEDTGVIVVANHPGVIRTALGVPKGPLGWLLRFVKLFWGTPEQGAKAPVWLATAPAAAITNGRYYFLQDELALNEAATDAESAQKLWDFSADAAGLPRD